MNNFNFIVSNGNQKIEDEELFFGIEKVSYISDIYNMSDVLVDCGVFKSKSQARKNWKKSGMRIPEGFSEFKNIGKLRKSITILNPIGN